MSLHGFRNTTGAPVSVGSLVIGANASSNFYDDALYNLVFGSDINAGVLENASGFNQNLALGVLVYVQDAADKTPEEFYTAWHRVYNETSKISTSGTPSGTTSDPGNSVVYYSSTVPHVIANTAETTSLLSSAVVLGVDAQAPGNITEIEATGSISYAAQDAAVTFTFNLGSTQVATFAITGSDITGLGVNTEYQWKLSAELGSGAANAANATVSLTGMFSISTPDGVLEVELQETAVVDTTVANTLSVLVKWDTASIDSSVVSKIAAVRQLNKISTAAPGNSVVYSNTVPRAVTSTAVESSLLAGTVALDVSAQAPGTITEIEAVGSISYAAQDAAVTFTFRMGPTPVTAFTVTGSDIAGLETNTAYQWKLSAQLGANTANAANATVSLTGMFSISTPDGVLEVELQETNVVDTTVVNNFDVTAQWLVASANSSVVNKISAIRQMNTSNLVTPALIGAEVALGNPTVSGYVLSSTVAGVRSWVPMSGGGGSGSVTSVGLTVPSIFTAGAAVTADGSLSFTINSQAANLVLAAPNGAAGVPGFRSLVIADISNLGSWAGSVSIASVGTVTTGVWNGTAIDVEHGGTGRSSWTQYGLVVASTSSTLANLALGTSGQVLVSGAAAGLPTWQDVATLAAPAVTGAEPALGNPSTDNQVLASSTDGTRTWTQLPRSGVRSTTGNTILDSDFCIRYTGLVDVVFQLPAATGSSRTLRFIHAGSAAASLYVSSTANNGNINDDTLLQITKETDGATCSVDVTDVDVGLWNLF